MNLRRLFDTTDDPRTGDVVLTGEAFARRIDQIAGAITALLRGPDLIEVQEAETFAVLEALTRRLGGGYRAFLEEGNDPGGIDIGFLVNTARITVISVQQEGRTAVYTTPSGATATLHDRPPLVLRGRIGDFPFRAVAVHLRSLINATTPEVRAKRLAQAQAVADLARRLEADNPSEGLVVLGDFNAFPFDDGLVDLVGIVQRGPAVPLQNLTLALPRDQGYTFIQEGVAQTLDHMLINAALRSRWSRYQVAHINADFGGTGYSDHDPPIATFVLDPAMPRTSAAGGTNAATFLTGEVAPGEIVSIFGSGIGASSRVLFNGRAATVLGAASGQVVTRVPEGNFDELTLRVGDSNEVRLPVAAAAPGIFGVLRNNEVADVWVTG
jgi:hypothetical protein